MPVPVPVTVGCCSYLQRLLVLHPRLHLVLLDLQTSEPSIYTVSGRAARGIDYLNGTTRGQPWALRADVKLFCYVLFMLGNMSSVGVPGYDIWDGGAHIL